jgi:hypothetical protein
VNRKFSLIYLEVGVGVGIGVGVGVVVGVGVGAQPHNLYNIKFIKE